MKRGTFVLAALLGGCAGVHYPLCPPPSNMCALETDAGKTYFVGIRPDGPDFCRCPDKPVSPQ